MKKTPILVLAGLCAASAFAAGANRDDFLRQQAYAEMQRVSGQVDVIQNNQEDLARRVSKLEKGDGSRGEVESLRAEVASLRAQISELRRGQENLRAEIVRDLMKRIDSAQPAPAPKAASKPALGPHKEYTVQSGDTLSLIAEAFGTSVSKLKEMNPNVKPSSLRVGQKIKVPVK